MSHRAIYITGASGFIGSHLSKKLYAENIVSYPVSRKKTKLKNSILVDNYKDIIPKKNSILIHLAETNDIHKADSTGELFVKMNKKLLIELIKKKWDHIIYISTALINEKNHLNKSYLAKKNFFYIRSKLECERIVLKNNGTVLRMTNLYGPGMSENNVFSDILKQLNKKQIKLKNLKAKRDFLWIDDAVDAILFAINNKSKNIFNIASNNVISVHNLVKIFLKITGQKKRIIGIEDADDEIDFLRNIKKTLLELKWKPSTNLEVGIKKLLLYNRTNVK